MRRRNDERIITRCPSAVFTRNDGSITLGWTTVTTPCPFPFRKYFHIIPSNKHSNCSFFRTLDLLAIWLLAIRFYRPFDLRSFDFSSFPFRSCGFRPFEVLPPTMNIWQYCLQCQILCYAKRITRSPGDVVLQNISATIIPIKIVIKALLFLLRITLLQT